MFVPYLIPPLSLIRRDGTSGGDPPRHSTPVRRSPTSDPRSSSNRTAKEDQEEKIKKEAKELEKLLEAELEKEERIPDWIRCSPADLFFRRDHEAIQVVPLFFYSNLNQKFPQQFHEILETIPAFISCHVIFFLSFMTGLSKCL